MKASPAFSLVSRSAAEDGPLADQLHEGIRPGELDALRTALPVYQQLLAPAVGDDAMWLYAQMTRAMALLGGGWPIAQRKEWNGIAAELLADLPIYLVRPAIARVMLKVSYAGEVVKAIAGAIEEEHTKLCGECATLERTIRLVEMGASRATSPSRVGAGGV